MGRFILNCLVIGIFTSSLVLAQENQAQAAEQSAKQAPLQGTQPLSLSSPALSFVPGQQGAVILESTEKDSSLIARVGYEIGDFLLFGRLSAKLDEGAKEVTLSSLDELRAPTLATLGLSYQFAQVVSGAPAIEATCKRFRQEIFDIFAAKRPRFTPISIEKNECDLGFLEANRNDIFFDALRARNIKLNALCDEYNETRGSGRLLASRPDDRNGAPMVFEEGADALKAAFKMSCTEANLIAALQEEAKTKAEMAFRAELAAKGESVIEAKVAEKRDEAAQQAEKDVKDQLAKSILPFCQEYNNHAYPLLRKLEPEGALPVGATPDRGCEFEAIRTVLADPALSDVDGFRERWEAEIARQFPFSFWSFTASITEGKNEFKVFDPARFDPASQDPIADASRNVSKTSRNLTVGLARFNNLWSVGGGYIRKLDIKVPSKTSVCVPLNGTLVQQCFSSVITDPREKETDLLSFEAKRFLGSRLGLQLRVLHDLDQSETEPHLSLYFLNQEGKGLTGGIEVFYSSQSKRVEGRVFVGAAFSVFPNGN